MMLHLHSVPRLLWRSALVLAGVALPLTGAQAQAGRWTVDPKTSLAWWQMDPNLNHLWATTCPGDPDWRPGEGRSSGWTINKNLKMPGYGYANVEDTIHMPLFPRHTVRPVCVEAVSGEVFVPDTIHWRGVHGTVSVQGDALISGERMRDVMMHQAIETAQFPAIQFTVDSLVNVTKQGDTLHASAIGTMQLRDLNKPVVAAVQAFHDGGGMRVLVKWHVPATDLNTMAPMLHNMSLGVRSEIWKLFFMGADIVLRPAPSTASTGN